MIFLWWSYFNGFACLSNNFRRNHLICHSGDIFLCDLWTSDANSARRKHLFWIFSSILWEMGRGARSSFGYCPWHESFPGREWSWCHISIFTCTDGWWHSCFHIVMPVVCYLFFLPDVESRLLWRGRWTISGIGSYLFLLCVRYCVYLFFMSFLSCKVYLIGH